MEPQSQHETSECRQQEETQGPLRCARDSVHEHRDDQHYEAASREQPMDYCTGDRGRAPLEGSDGHGKTYERRDGEDQDWNPHECCPFLYTSKDLCIAY